MRLLTIVSDLRPGGTQRVACNFARAYAAAGIDSALFAYKGGGALESSTGRDVELFMALEEALRWRPDVVHIHREGPADPRTAVLLHAVKTASRAGSSAPIGVMETNVFGRVDYSADALNIDVHFLLSRWCLWKWRRWSRAVAGEPLGIVLPNLVMHEDFAPIRADARTQFRARWNIPQEALLFGRVGSPIESKWSRETLDAFAAHGRQNPGSWLLLIGIPTALREQLESLPENIRSRISTIDFLHGDAALREAYGSMDVFLHTARIGESFGMVLAESLLCGTPVVTLSTPAKDNSQLEVVGHEQGGLVAANVAGLIEAMSRLQSPTLRERYAKQGAASIVERYGPEALIPAALRVASLCAEGLPRAELRRRLLALPEVCSDVSTGEIRALMRRSLGRYSLTAPALLHLVSNPLVYRAYRAVKGK
jgi:glycosyltransferase involved in cell wall biosynthesis